MNSIHFQETTSYRALCLGLSIFVAGFGPIRAVGQTKNYFSLYKSTDRGTSWEKAGHGLPSDARINALTPAGDQVLAGTDRGILISRDAGEHWWPPPQGLGTESRVLCFATLSGRIFAGTDKQGVLVSEDQGVSWDQVNTGLTDLFVRSLLAMRPRLYAGTDHRGVFFSDNGGISWADRRTGLPDSSQVFDLAALGGTVFAGLYSKGLYRWDAARGRWERSGEVVPLEIVAAGETLVVGHNPGGIFVSEDHGKSWQEGNWGLPANAPIWTLAAGDDRVWAGASGWGGLDQTVVGLFVSNDRGKSWARSAAGLPPSGAAVSFLVTKQLMLVGISFKAAQPALPRP